MDLRNVIEDTIALRDYDLKVNNILVERDFHSTLPSVIADPRSRIVWEGGMREPFIAWWPGRVPAGRTVADVVSTLDLLPTFLALAGGKPPAAHG